jgi:hypothetical protein
MRRTARRAAIARTPWNAAWHKGTTDRAPPATGGGTGEEGSGEAWREAASISPRPFASIPICPDARIGKIVALRYVPPLYCTGAVDLYSRPPPARPPEFDQRFWVCPVLYPAEIRRCSWSKPPALASMSSRSSRGLASSDL